MLLLSCGQLHVRARTSAFGRRQLHHRHRGRRIPLAGRACGKRAPENAPVSPSHGPNTRPPTVKKSS